jgi:hypothetical protein
MSAPLERFKSDSRKFRKLLASFIRHMRIIFGVEDHYFRRRDFGSVMPRIVKSPASQLFPVRIRKAIPVPKRFANIFCITLLRGFDLFGTIQNLPVHHRTICDHPLHLWVKGCKNCCRAPEASSDDEDLIRRKAEAPTERDFFNFLWQIVNDVEDIFMATSPESARRFPMLRDSADK